MSGPLTRFARRWWAGAYGVPGTLLRVVLTPLSWVWRGVTRFRNQRWDARGGTVIQDARVVSVGNLAVGGTGKTPVSAWVARTLGELEDQRPALLLSGYGTDEVLLHRSWNPEMPVVADPDRIAGARRAVRDGATSVVVDDGFQHRRMARDLDVVLLSVDDPFPAGVMPVGPYREPVSSLARADVILLTRRRASLDAVRAMVARVEAVPGVRRGAVLGCVRLTSDGIVPLHRASAGEAPASDPLCDGAVALTAIARPEAFRRDVDGLASGPVELVAYADHHDFTDADARRARERAGARPIVVTEKDAVKLGELADALGDTWVLRERVAWDWGEDALRARLVEMGGPSPERGA